MSKSITKIDRYEGAMLGVAVGDALGAPLEFMSAQEIGMKHGDVREMIGGGWLSVVPGEVTDDTQMTLAVAEGMAADGDSRIAPYLMVGANFLRWYRSRPKDVGNTCAAVLSRMDGEENVYLIDWHKAAEAEDKRTRGRTAGNGALMRTVYPALYHHITSRAVEAATTIAKMTHWSEDSTETVALYTEAINVIVNSEMTAERARKQIPMIMRVFLEQHRKPGSELRPTGYSVDSLVCAVTAIECTDSFEEALVFAVNLGGDADTIGAITGGLAGAVYGASAIPLRWVNALANEPNRRTVRMFHDTQDATTQGNANTLTLRLAELAKTAYYHRKR